MSWWKNKKTRLSIILVVAVMAAVSTLIVGDGAGLQGRGPAGEPNASYAGVPASGYVPSQNATQVHTQSAIKNLIVVIPENHSFDSFYGRYCTAPTGSNPTCAHGRQCCEAGPATEPGPRHAHPIVLSDHENMIYDPNHSQKCELLEMDGGKMDGYVSNSFCGNRQNFAYADAKSAGMYWKLAAYYALADHYFQPLAGASSSNDMYFARAQYVFTDNDVEPDAIGSECGDINKNQKTYTDPTIGTLLTKHGVPWVFYAEGYRKMFEARAIGRCPPPNPACAPHSDAYPCIYDPGDDPFDYYYSTQDNPNYLKDYSEFFQALKHGTLPSVSFVKPIGFKTSHPGGANITDSEKFLAHLLDAVMGSSYANSTLVLVVPDESGGYFDHIAPPPNSPADGKPYGPRIPFLAIGRFARKGTISHVTMEHSSVVKFIEWNWLNGRTGQLQGRDAIVNNIGSMLDQSQTGVPVPTH